MNRSSAGFLSLAMLSCDTVAETETDLFKKMKEIESRFVFGNYESIVHEIVVLFKERITDFSKYKGFIETFAKADSRLSYDPMLKSFLLMYMFELRSDFPVGVTLVAESILADPRIDISMNCLKMVPPGQVDFERNKVRAQFIGSPNFILKIFRRAEQDLTEPELMAIYCEHVWKRIELSRLHLALRQRIRLFFRKFQDVKIKFIPRFLEHPRLTSVFLAYTSELLSTYENTKLTTCILKRAAFEEQNNIRAKRLSKAVAKRMDPIKPVLRMHSFMAQLLTATDDNFEGIMISLLVPPYLLVQKNELGALSYSQIGETTRSVIAADIAYQLSNGIGSTLKEFLNELNHVQQFVPSLLAFLAFVGDIELFDKVRGLFETAKAFRELRCFGEGRLPDDELSLSSELFVFNNKVLAVDEAKNRRTFPFFSSPALVAALYNQPQLLRHLFVIKGASEAQVATFMGEVSMFCDNFRFDLLRSSAETCFITLMQGR